MNSLFMFSIGLHNATSGFNYETNYCGEGNGGAVAAGAAGASAGGAANHRFADVNFGMTG